MWPARPAGQLNTPKESASPKKPVIRAAAVQIAPDLTSPAPSKRLDAIPEAAGRGAELIVFPETFVPYYPYFSFVLPPAQQGPEHLRLYEEAVVVPSAETRAVAATEAFVAGGGTAVTAINTTKA